MALLIAGGNRDPNLELLITTCSKSGVPIVDFRHGQGYSPHFAWDINTNTLYSLDHGSPVRACFVRHDVFESLNSGGHNASLRALNWYQAIYGWLLANEKVAIFNRAPLSIFSNKAAMLVAARNCGLRVPPTLLTNEEARIREYGCLQGVTKPAGGGDYCYAIENVLPQLEVLNGVTASPAFVQLRLVAPEIRIYIIGNRTFAFEMRSKSLDYRVKQDVEVIPLVSAPREAGKLRKLMTQLGMNYGAADFKTESQSGELAFMELNSSPMFAKFDHVVNGAITASIIEELLAL